MFAGTTKAQCPNCNARVQLWDSAFPSNQICYICVCGWTGTQVDLEATFPLGLTRAQALSIAMKILRGNDYEDKELWGHRGLWGYPSSKVASSKFRHDLNWLTDILMRVSGGETSNEEILKEVGQ